MLCWARWIRQIGSYPAASILSVVERKPIEQVDDNTLILADISRKAISAGQGDCLADTKGESSDEQAEEPATSLPKVTSPMIIR